MRAKFPNIERLPIRVVLLYVAATFFIFIFGPFEWPVDNWAIVIAFLALSMACVWVGLRFEIARASSECTSIDPRCIIILGSVSAVALLFVTRPVYTGKTPWQVFDALRDPGGAYSALQDQLELTSGTRDPIALARILTWPLVFSAIVLGIVQWTQLSTTFRLLVVVVLLSILIL